MSEVYELSLYFRICIPVIDWEEDISRQDNGHTRVTVPLLQSPLNPEQMEQLRSAIDPMGPSDSLGMDI